MILVYEHPQPPTTPWFDGLVHLPVRRGVYEVSSRFDVHDRPTPMPEDDPPDLFSYWDVRWGRWKLSPEVDMTRAQEQRVWWRGIPHDYYQQLTKDIRGTNWRISYDASTNPSRTWTARWGGVFPPSGVGEDMTTHNSLQQAVEWLLKKGAKRKELSPALFDRLAVKRGP
jgi:hypothetical protein